METTAKVTVHTASLGGKYQAILECKEKKLKKVLEGLGNEQDALEAALNAIKAGYPIEVNCINPVLKVERPEVILKPRPINKASKKMQGKRVLEAVAVNHAGEIVTYQEAPGCFGTIDFEEACRNSKEKLWMTKI